MSSRDWKLCFICQSNLKEPTVNPSISVKLKDKHDKLLTCCEQVTANIKELYDLGELTNSIFTDDIEQWFINESSSIVFQMVSNQVVWHKSCRSLIDNQKVQRARKRHQEQVIIKNSPIKTRRFSNEPCTSKIMNTSTCIFCDEVGDKNELRKASTLKLNKKVNDCAKLLRDKELLTKLSSGDMIAIDAVYHRACLTQLYRRADSICFDTTENNSAQVIRAHVLNEILDFINDKRDSRASIAMVDLTSLYDNRLAAHGFPHIKCNTTRLREEIESMIPDIKSVMNKNRSWSLVFDEDLSDVISEMKDNTSTEVSILFKAAKILRKDCLRLKQTFTGSFSESNSESVELPTTLSSFLHTLLEGSDILQEPSNKSKIVTSIGHQIIYNSVGRKSSNPERIPRHIRDRETPSVIYMAMKLYLKSGSKSVLDVMHQRGLCISYDRLLVLSTDIANSVIAHWENLGVVVPPQAVKNVFTTGAFDNIDHNPSSTTAKSALHGTCISIHQHNFSSNTQQTENIIDILNSDEMGQKHVRSLPSSYKTLDYDVSLPKDERRYVPDLGTNNHPHPPSCSLERLLKDGYTWLENLKSSLSKQTLERDEWISWAAYFASITEPPTTPPTKSYMLPLFTESSNNPAMVWHGMKIISQATNYINPGQTPVMEVDQPLFTLAKQLQWNFPQSEIGEDSFLVTLGALHIEKMLWMGLCLFRWCAHEVQ